MAKMTKKETEEYAWYIKDAKQIEFDLNKLRDPVIYGYARVSTKGQARDGNSLEAQEKELRSAGAKEVVSDAYTGSVTNRPELDRLLEVLNEGDTLMVTKLDRIARSVTQGIELISRLNERGINVHVLNMGLMDDSPTGKLIRNVMLSFAEFERSMILQRTMEGKQIARTKAGFREGRPKKYNREQLDLAMQQLENYSYKQVAKMTGISTATLAREKARRRTVFTENQL